MKGHYRLRAPAMAFPVVGLVALVLTTPGAESDIRGGLPAVGVYALCWQVALTAFLIASFPEFGTHAHDAGGLGGAEFSFEGFWTVMRTFYLRRFQPMLALAFGFGASCAIVVIGLLDRSSDFSASGPLQPSEEGLAVVLLVTAIALGTRAGAGSVAGWCYGFSVAVAVAELKLVSDSDPSATISGWFLIATVLVVLLLGTRILVRGGRRLRRRTQSKLPAPAHG